MQVDQPQFAGRADHEVMTVEVMLHHTVVMHVIDEGQNFFWQSII